MTDKTGARAQYTDEGPEDLILAVTPVHKRAFGTAVGLTLGGLVFLATVYATLRGNAPEELSLLSNYFLGYTVSWSGAVIGFAWGVFTFSVAGWFCAYVRNLTIAASVWIVLTRAELEASRDFLDHI